MNTVAALVGVGWEMKRAPIFLTFRHGSQRCEKGGDIVCYLLTRRRKPNKEEQLPPTVVVFVESLTDAGTVASVTSAGF